MAIKHCVLAQLTLCNLVQVVSVGRLYSCLPDSPLWDQRSHQRPGAPSIVIKVGMKRLCLPLLGGKRWQIGIRFIAIVR